MDKGKNLPTAIGNQPNRRHVITKGIKTNYFAVEFPRDMEPNSGLFYHHEQNW
tara:strand:- start:245 stop:403 length:159 start_codon:yes stop_codon:yes gene_type:complete